MIKIIGITLTVIILSFIAFLIVDAFGYTHKDIKDDEPYLKKDKR